MPSVLFIPTQRTHVDAFAPLLRNTSFRHGMSNVDVLTSITRLESTEIGNPDHLFSFEAPRQIPLTRLCAKAATSARATRWWRDFGLAGRYGLIVVGNDGGGFQKLLIHLARRAGIPSLLLQDGLLRYAVHPPTTQWLHAKRSRLLHSLGHLNQHVSSYPGNYATFAGVYGEATKRIFIANGFPSSNIFVVGSPRHRELRDRVRPLRERAVQPDELRILFLPANHRRSGQLDAAMAQDACLKQLMEQAQAVDEATTTRVRVTVKPHPREDVGDYQWLLEAYPTFIDIVEPHAAYAELLANADAVLGVSSTGLLDAAIAGCRTAQFLPSRLRSITPILGATPITSAEQTREYLMGLAAGVSDAKVTRQALSDEIADANPEWDSVAACVNLIQSLSSVTPRTTLGRS